MRCISCWQFTNGKALRDPPGLPPNDVAQQPGPLGGLHVWKSEHAALVLASRAMPPPVSRPGVRGAPPGRDSGAERGDIVCWVRHGLGEGGNRRRFWRDTRCNRSCQYVA
jgi:hypothetical protein